MLAKFSMLKPYKFYRDIRIVFDTKKKSFENSCIIFTDSQEGFVDITKSGLFNQQYIRGFFMERFLDKSLYKRLIPTNRSDVYQYLKDNTSLTILPLNQGILRNKNCYFAFWNELINIFNMPGSKNKQAFMRNFAIVMEKMTAKVSNTLYKESYAVIDGRIFNKGYGSSEPEWIRGNSISSLLYLHVRDVLSRKAYGEWIFAGRKTLIYDPISKVGFPIPEDISKLSLAKFRWIVRLMQKASAGKEITENDLEEEEDNTIAANAPGFLFAKGNNPDKSFVFYKDKAEAFEEFAKGEYSDISVSSSENIITILSSGGFKDLKADLSKEKIKLFKSKMNIDNTDFIERKGSKYKYKSKAEFEEQGALKIEKSDEKSLGLKFVFEDILEGEEVETIKNKVVNDIGGMKNSIPMTSDQLELKFQIDDRIDEILSEKGINDALANIDSDQELGKLKNNLNASRLLSVQNKRSSEVVDALSKKQLDADLTIDGENFKLSEKLKILEKSVLEPSFFEFDAVNPEITKSSMKSFRSSYMKDLYELDQYRIFTRFKESKDIPIFVESINRNDTSDALNEKETLEIKFNIAGERPKSMNIDVPKVDQDGYLFLQGSRRQITTQIATMPISKIFQSGELVVMYTTAYNKIFLSRNGGNFSRQFASLVKAFNKLKDDGKNIGKDYAITMGSSVETNEGFMTSLEYFELSKKLVSVSFKNTFVYMSQPKVRELFEQKSIDMNVYKELFPDSDFFPIGIYKEKIPLYAGTKGGVFIPKNEDESEEISLDINSFIIETSKSYEIISSYIAENKYTGKNLGYTRLEVSNAYIPLLVFLGFKDGLENLFEKYSIEYNFITKDKESKLIELDPFFKEKVIFKDGTLYFKPDSIKKNLLFNGIYQLPTKDFNFSEFGMDGEGYYKFFIDNITPRYGKALQNFYTLFIDPITEDILKDNNIPYDITGSFLYCNDLLEDASYLKRCDMNLYRLRNMECINDLLYKLVAKQIEKYRRGSRGDTSGTLAVRSDALIMEINASPIFEDSTILNPTKEIENFSKAVYKGPGAPAYQHDQGTEEIRFFDDSMRGIFGISSSFDASAGMNRRLSMNSLITSKRGYVKPSENVNNLDATNFYSIGELGASFSTRHADPERMMMTVAQTGHQLSTVDMDKALVSSGIFKAVPYFVSSEFAFKAPEDGEVIKYNEKLKLLELKYKDGSKGFIDMGVKYRRSPDGFFVTIEQETKLKSGNKFKKGEILSSDKHFFDSSGADVEMYKGTIAKIAVAARDITLEDSSVITEGLSKKLKSTIVMETQLMLSKSSNLISIAGVGKDIKTSESLAVFEEHLEDESISKALEKLESLESSLEAIAQNVKTSKYTGKIVDIEIFYNHPIEEYSESIQALLKSYIHSHQSRMKELLGIRKDQFISRRELGPLKNGRAKGVPFEGVLINFYIEIEEDFSSGDKLTYTVALKSVCGEVVPDKLAPYSSFRPEENVDAILSPFSVLNRKVPDFFFLMFTDKVLIEMKRKIADMIKS
jgi:hypothetical protein